MVLNPAKRWEVPVLKLNHTVIDLSKTGNKTTWEFAPDEDVLFIASHQTRTLDRLQTTGGNNIVLIGGKFEPNDHATAAATLNFTQVSGSVYVEGVHIDHRLAGEKDAISFYSAAGKEAGFTLQNSLIENVKGTYGGVHGDVFQPQGPTGDLRFYNVTGSTTYQGLFLQPKNPIKSVQLENVEMIKLPGGDAKSWLYYFSQPNDPKYPVSLKNVYVTEQPGQLAEYNSVYPPIGLDGAVRSGDSITFPNLPYTGLMKVGTAHFVSSDMVGINYDPAALDPVATFRGTAGDDIFQGGNGTDTVDYSWATAGQMVDLFLAKSSGGSGKDQIHGIENVTGTSLADKLIGNTGNNKLDGGAGDDITQGGSGNDVLIGGSGNDNLKGDAGNDWIDGGKGNDILDGGGGFDTADYSASSSAASIDLGKGIATSGGWTDTIVSVEAIAGSAFNDNLVGNWTTNFLAGNDGNDILKGWAGDDWLSGGAGNDTLDGGTGADRMLGGLGDDVYIVDNAGDTVEERSGEGVDTVYASIDWTLSNSIENLTITSFNSTTGRGNDLANIITGGTGNDVLYGLGGDDKIYGQDGNDYLYGGDGNDRIDGGAGNDVLKAGDGNDVLLGGDGNDWLEGSAGADTMSGGTGDDTYIVEDAADIVIERIDEGIDTVRARISHTLAANIENLTLEGGALDGIGNDLANVIKGTEAAQVIKGMGGNDTIYGYGGEDRIDGGSGNDLIYGGDGNDILLGGDGNDRIDGGSGVDQLAGGNGDDTYIIDSVWDEIIELPGGGTDTIRSVVTITLADEVEHLFLDGRENLDGVGNELSNRLQGNAGDNQLKGMNGDDLLYGWDGNDRLEGGAGNDALDGGNGDDVLIGGAGRDRLNGGAGADRFVFESLGDSGRGWDQRDNILDFKPGTDLIDLTRIDADATEAGDQAFSFIGQSGFTGAASQLRWYEASGVRIVQGDVDGDGVSDFEIQITAPTSLDKSFFLL
jgi:Ca2+-binding RTX toxin-like protein